MNISYKKVLLIFVQLCCFSLLALFILIALAETRYFVTLGIIISLFILSTYLYIIKKSLDFLNQERLALAYFLTIGGFLALIFIQLISCTQRF
jgi:hypothetical protein